MSDPTVQGYCSVIVPPCVSPGSNGGGGGVTGCAPSTTPAKPSTPTAAPAPVSLTPVVVVAVVKGREHTVATPTTGVKGAQRTASAPVARAAAAPIATTKTTGTLPFTGAQLALFALVGLALLATGLLLRSTGRPSQRR
jgi:hypothetical protein